MKQFWNFYYENLDLSSPVIMKIWTVHHENLNRSSWESRPFNIKISTVQHQNLDRSSWKSWPFIMKISTDHHENFDCPSWKSGSFKIKISAFDQNGVPYILAILCILKLEKQFIINFVFHCQKQSSVTIRNCCIRKIVHKILPKFNCNLITKETPTLRCTSVNLANF